MKGGGRTLYVQLTFSTGAAAAVCYSLMKTIRCKNPCVVKNRRQANVTNGTVFYVYVLYNTFRRYSKMRS